MTSLLHSHEPRAAGAIAPPIAADTEAPRPLAEARWDWSKVRRVLVVRLRSIGDTVLATPALAALRRFVPEAQIDIVLEDWVAPVLEGFGDARVIPVERSGTASRASAALRLRSADYDVAYNLHGGTTATLMVRASGAKHRVGFANYQYRWLYNHAAPESTAVWNRSPLHSAEQQLALLGWTGVPVTGLPPSRLAVLPGALARVQRRLRESGIEQGQPFALIHPAAAFETKTWAAANFARVCEYLSGRGIACVAIAAKNETAVLEKLVAGTCGRLVCFDDLPLPGVTAMSSLARLFVGNDSGIAHMAAAVNTPSVIVFGSSNVNHWRPWTRAPHEVVREVLPCQPCPGYTCEEFGVPECIRRVRPETVIAAIDRVLAAE